MNKSDLVDRIAQKAGVTKKQAQASYEAVTEGISEALSNGEAVTLIGFGTYSVKQRSARTGINPRTKEKITIAAKKVVKFKAGSALSDSVK
ncbi:MAG: HU family DNA-binding protein [Nitrospinae bacterium]|nr:HU family DNA-binding protein [Nitrospinota bacterium]